MDSKSSSIEIVCGVLIGVFAVWLIGGSGGHEVLPGAENKTNATSIPEVVTIAPAVERESQESPNDTYSVGSDPRSSIETTVDPVAPWPESLRTELKLEPKDDSWAHYMEQTLLQYLSVHPSIYQFDISNIECKTTKCQIEVFGFDESTAPVWQQVMYDIREQLWKRTVKKRN